MIGWTGEIQGRTLVIYKLAFFKTGPESNSDDCGVFTCLYAQFLVANCRFDFSQSDIPREKMKSELLQKMLL